MPNDNIKRTIEKALGTGNSDNYEQVTYEGYGPGGVAVIVDAMTDNRNRTAAEIRHHFDKYGGNMGASGCVSWSFQRKGVIVIDNEERNHDEDQVLSDALEAGADDIEIDGDVYEVYTAPDDLMAVSAALESAGYTFLAVEIEMIPQSYIKLADTEDIKNMEKMLDLMEDNEDVQNVWHNYDR